MLFNLGDILENFEPYLQNWFSKARNEELEPVYELYAATLFRPRGYLEQRFLYLVQALETYHHRTNHISRRPLTDRLKEIFHKHQEIILLIPNFTSDFDTFADKVTKARNWFTHYNEKQRKYKPDNKTLYEMTQHLRFVVEICLLTEMGIPESKIKELIRRVSR